MSSMLLHKYMSTNVCELLRVWECVGDMGSWVDEQMGG